jgi:DNA topoisomerase-1
VTDKDTLARIRALAIPPAWTGVWIAPSAAAHLQATGRDARGRKQYRYHANWRQHRDETKYTRLIAFAAALPRIRRRTQRDLETSGLTRTKVLAAVVQLLEKTLIRVGNEEYARTNGSFGLTTMRDQHVEVDGKQVQFEFTGKSGVQHRVRLEDPRLARVVKRCQDLPGQVLFQYLNGDGVRQAIDSADINQYLREICEADFTAKDFRTWAGTVLAAMALREFESLGTKAETKRNVVRAIERVAARLGNTTAVCRKCYVHPAVLDAYLDGSLVEVLGHRARTELANTSGGLSAAETAVLALLQRRLEKTAQKRRKRT